MLGFGDSAAFGFLDEAGAVFDSVIPTPNRENIWTSGRSFSEAWRTNVERNRDALEESSEEHFGAHLAGGIAGAIVIPAGSGAKGALQVAKVGAVQGAVYGVGSGEGFQDRLVTGAQDAALGGVLGAALGSVAGRIGKAFGRGADDAGEGLVGRVTDDTVGDDGPFGAVSDALPENLEVLGMARGNVPITRAVAAADEAGEAVSEAVPLGEGGSIGRAELASLQGDAAAFASRSVDEGDRAFDVTWETAARTAEQTGEWRIGSLGSTDESMGLLRGLVEQLAPKGVRADADLAVTAAKAAQDMGEDPDSIIAAAREIAGPLGDADTAMMALRTVWSKASEQVTDFHLMGVDWSTASDDLVAEAAQRIYNLATLSHHVQRAKTGLGRGLRVNQLPAADEYLARLSQKATTEAAEGAATPTGIPLPKSKQELSDWFELWGLTGGDPRRQAKLLEGLLTIPTGSKYLRQSFANFFTASILSMPRTVALNVVGPQTIGAVRQVERLVGAGSLAINPFKSAAERASARAVAKASAAAYLQTFTEMGDIFRAAMTAAETNHTVIGGGGQTVDAVSSFGPFTDNLLRAAGKEPSASYKLGNLINVWPRAFARLNNGLDEFSKRLAYQSEVRVRAMVEASEQGLKGEALQRFVQRKMESAYDAVGHATQQQALRSAERTTLTAQVGEPGGRLREAYNWLQGLRADVPEVRYILPILNVPANGLAETLRRLPIARIPGVNNVLFNTTARELAGEFGPVIQADAHGRTLLAAGFLLGASQMSRMGILTGAGPREPTDRKIWLATHQPYSIRMGDQWVRYDKFDVVGGLLSIPATVMDYSTYRPEDQDESEMWWAGVGALGQWFRDRAALRSAAGIFSIGENPVQDAGSVATQLAGSVTSGFYPAALRGLITDGMTNPYMPLRRSWTDYIESVMPGNDVEVVRNVLGEPVQKPLNSVTEALVPVSMVKAVGYDEDPVLDELDRLYQTTGYGAGADTTAFSYGFFADKDLKLEDGRSLYTHAMQLRQTMRLEGKTLKESLADLFQSEDYNSAVDGDSQRRKTSRGEFSRGFMVMSLFKSYNQAIKRQMASESPMAKAYMAAAAAKRADDAYLRDVSVEELVNNPELWEAKGIDRGAYEGDLTGDGGPSAATQGLLEAFS